MRLTRVQAAVAAGIMALATSAGAALAGTGAASAAQLPGSAARASARTPGYLYYDAGDYIARVPVAGGTPQRIVWVGNGSVTGMAISDGRLF